MVFIELILMPLVIFILLWMLGALTACGQQLRLVTPIPPVLSENSGLLISPQGRLWLHNDSGDSAKFYEMDTLGRIQQTVVVDGIRAVDWEDITQDEQGHVYVGDFGNNNNNRRDLVIYQLPTLDTLQSRHTTATAIRFYYPEQQAFPPASTGLKYDTEALVYYQDSLYVFTKDRTRPHLGYTWLYRIPAEAGYHTAQLLDSFKTEQSNVFFEVTGAALSPDGKKLALLGATRLWLFSNFTGANFFDGDIQTINFSGISQKEALDFVDNNLLYIGNESSFLGVAQLHALELPPSVLQPSTGNTISPIALFANPAQKQVQIEFELTKKQPVHLHVHNQEGRLAQTWLSRKQMEGKQVLQFSTKELAAGIYYIHLWVGKIHYLKRLHID